MSTFSMQSSAFQDRSLCIIFLEITIYRLDPTDCFPRMLEIGASRSMVCPLADISYAQHFSPPNQVLSIANHSLILLDSVGLVEEDYRRYAAEMQFGEWDGVAGGVIEFVKEFSDGMPSTLAVSHYPDIRRSPAGTQDLALSYTLGST